MEKQLFLFLVETSHHHQDVSPLLANLLTCSNSNKKYQQIVLGGAK